ncbi:MAG: AAA family ATPase, partial [Clostridia bacterium]
VIEDVCGETACYLSHLYEAETFVAARLEQLMGCQIKTELDMGETVSRIESAARLSYAPLQREAVCAAANNPVMILTGGPGTGKTTVIQGMLELFSRMGLSVSLAAPTGRAAKRMSEFCGVEAATIHRMLEQDYTDGSGLPTFGKNEGNPLETDVLIIDEMSMVDIMLMRAVLAALPTSCRLVMVGDSDQLPSIGAGNVLKDLIAADIITSIRLTEIFRQAQSSNIVVSAHAINRGEFPDFAGRDSDMFFLQRHDANSVIETTVELCRDRLPKNMGIPASQIQVLTPSRKYDVGTIILNRRLQDALNPASQDKNEHRVGDKLFRVGDRVMQIRNNYDLAWHNLDGADSGLGVFNGDIGEIIAIDANVELLSVQYDERVVHYAFTMLCELELAYAMTVHKAQGSEFRAVVFAALGGSDFLLHRSVLYTAITRARSLLVLVSDKDTIKTMISNNRQRNRYTALRYRIVTGLGGV